MHTLTPEPPEVATLRDDAEWQRIVARARAAQPELVDAFFAAFPAAEVYEGRVAPGELDDLVADTMEMYLTLLEGRALDDRRRRIPDELGRRRAQQGVQLELLLDGVRTSSRIIWAALRDRALASEAPALVRHADTVLGCVEWMIRATQLAYLAEADRLARTSERRTRRALARLFEAGRADDGRLGRSAGDAIRGDDGAAGAAVSSASASATAAAAAAADEVAAELRIDAAQPIEVAVRAGAHDEVCRACAADPRLLHHEFDGMTAHLRPERPGEAAARPGVRLGVLLGAIEPAGAVHGDTDTAESGRGAVPERRTGRGAAPVAVVRAATGLAEVPAAARAAAELLRVTRSDGTASGAGAAGDANGTVRTPADAWPAVAWSALTTRLPARYLPADAAGLDGLPRAERERLASTAQRYLDTGSIKRTAEDLFCHRNTVVKRLARFEEVTGLRLTVPRDAALALLLLAGTGVRR